jgi:hypothetical protein
MTTVPPHTARFATCQNTQILVSGVLLKSDVVSLPLWIDLYHMTAIEADRLSPEIPWIGALLS